MNIEKSPIYELEPMQIAWMDYNAKLQQKKNALRKALKEKGILQKGGKNDFDHYSYFSEAQYKQLFTELFSDHGLELKFTELEYGTFEGTEKQANGRMPKIQFTLFDIETGFYEDTVITGEGIDKGDKAGYKAYTGALKYYLANTFMVATGDDPEKDSPAQKMNDRKERMASPKQVEVISRIFQDGERRAEMLSFYGITDISQLTMKQASDLISQMKGGN